MAAGPAREAILDAYSAQAKAEDPAFAGFSAKRGGRLYLGPHQGGNPETNACAACHAQNPAVPARHRNTGRGIELMAVSINPARFTKPDEVDMQFGRDCKNVLGRACTAQEKGDFITFLSGR